MARAHTSLHEQIWGDTTPVIGMLHLPPLPGSPLWEASMDRVLERASEEATALLDGGLDGVLVENYGDTPFFPVGVPAETVAAMAVVAREIVGLSRRPVGVNVLRNDARAALAVSAASGARFVRVNVHVGSMFTDQGLLSGRAHETLRTRAALDPGVAILADILVKHATPPPGLTLEAAARDTWFRGMADGLVLTGRETGRPVDPDAIRKVRAAVGGEVRVWVGSGATPDNCAELLDASDGMLVGSALQQGGRAGAGVGPSRVRDFMRALGRG